VNVVLRATAFDGHLQREERDVFPRARALLSERDIDEMTREIAARRLLRYASSNIDTADS
jgi:hypothetical protein